MQNFNNKCFSFQQQFIDLFNQEEEIPFLLKYYLISQVWLNIENMKNKIYQENKPEKIVQKTFTVPLSNNIEDNNEEE